MGSGLDLGNVWEIHFHNNIINLVLIIQKEKLFFSQKYISEPLVQVSVFISGTVQNCHA